ncbi:hypothetical protein RUND412_005961 [Rhizina undulata]
MKSPYLLTLLLSLTFLSPSSQHPVKDSYSNATSGSEISRCHKPPIRQEWRFMSTHKKKKYLAAVVCLANKPAITTAENPGAVSRFDDFNGVHSTQTPIIHWVGQFLPWHRYMLATYEKALREVCGYTGAQPQVPLTFNKLFTLLTQIGFGGDGPYEVNPDPILYPFNITGRSGGGCVPAGPFTEDKFKISLGPTTNTSIRNTRCLRRDFSEYIARSNLLQSVVDEVTNNSYFGAMTRRMEALPSFSVPNIHGGGHFAIGGSLGAMGNVNNSPGDPLFYLHHANLDRIWWNWQKQDLKKRLRDVSGPIVAFDYNNTLAGNVTLAYKINLGGLGGDVTLGQLMNVKGDFLCYDYDR